MKKYFIPAIFSMLACVTLLFAQGQEQTTIGDQAVTESAPAADENMQAGQYTRKSVSFINALWLLDKDTRGLKTERVAYMLDRIQKGISMKRFDYNPLPDAMLTTFVEKANAMDKLTIDDVAKLMESELVPQIMKILESDAEMRAANLLTEQQKNSFLSDKAKELGVTGEQIETILNSAYLYLPVLSDLTLATTGSDNKEKWVASAQIGILWYSLSLKGEKPTVTLRVKKMTRTIGMARVKSAAASMLTGGGAKGYSMDGETVTADEFAFRSMTKSAAKNLVVATQEIPEFNLSGQVLEVSGGTIGFDMGKNEGLRLDDKYKIMQLTENADGSVKEVNEGWVLTTMVADSNSKEGYKSKAKVISGSPMTGSILREYPRLGIDVHLGYKSFPISIDGGYRNSSGDSLSVGGMGHGLELMAMYNIGPKLKMNQLFLGFGWGMGWGSATGNFDYWSAQVDGVSFQSFEVPLLKRFYFGSLGLDAIAALTIQQCSFDLTTSLGTLGSISLANNTLGFSAGLKAEYALSPSLNFNAGALFQMNGKSTEWEYLVDGEALDVASGSFLAPLNHSGVSIRAGLTWSPPALPFDPWEMLRGSMGI